MVNIKTIREMLTRAIFEVFEKMYYIFSEPIEGHGEHYQMKSTINFSGSASGQIQIFLSRGIAEGMVKRITTGRTCLRKRAIPMLLWSTYPIRPV
jgi:hypothetical protein